VKWLNVGEGMLLHLYDADLGDSFHMPYPGIPAKHTRRRGPSTRTGGAGVLLGGHGLSMVTGKLLGVAFALGAAMFFALGTILNRSPLPISGLHRSRGKSPWDLC
jgi:hypothetical protein